MPNPYRLDVRNFTITAMMKRAGRDVFLVQVLDHSVFDQYLFRSRLSSFMLDALMGEWSIRNIGNDFELTVEKPFDVQLLRETFTVR